MPLLNRTEQARSSAGACCREDAGLSRPGESSSDARVPLHRCSQGSPGQKLCRALLRRAHCLSPSPSRWCVDGPLMTCAQLEPTSRCVPEREDSMSGQDRGPSECVHICCAVAPRCAMRGQGALLRLGRTHLRSGATRGPDSSAREAGGRIHQGTRSPVPPAQQALHPRMVPLGRRQGNDPHTQS